MELAFRAYGEHGAPVVVLHGLFGSGESWHSVCQKLATDYRVFAPDLRNHGNSPHSDEFDYSIMGEDVHKFIEARGLDAPHVIGHSMGGKVAMQLAISFPTQVRSLVIVDMAPGEDVARHKDLLQAMLQLDLRAFSTRKQMEDALQAAIPDLGTRRFLLKNVQRRPDGGFRWRLGLREIDKNYSSLTSSIRGSQQYVGPSLFVRGEESDYLQETDLLEIRHWFPRATVVMIEGAGHLVHVDQPQKMQQVLGDFLRATG